MRIVGLTCMWKRPEITRMTLRRAKRVRNELAGDVDFEIVCVGSEGQQSYDLVSKEGANYVGFPNRPLGAKWQHGATVVRDYYEPDYLFIFGSDDWFTSELIRDLLRVDQGAVGIRQCYVRSPDGNYYFWKGYGPGLRESETLGYGRLLRRDVLDEVKWNLWPLEKEKSLDQAMEKALGESIHVADLGENSAMLSIKSDINIWSFETLENYLKPCAPPYEFSREEMDDLGRLTWA